MKWWIGLLIAFVAIPIGINLYRDSQDDEGLPDITSTEDSCTQLHELLITVIADRLPDDQASERFAELSLATARYNTRLAAAIGEVATAETSSDVTTTMRTAFDVCDSLGFRMTAEQTERMEKATRG